MKRYLAIFILLVLTLICGVMAQEPVDLQIISHIKQEGFENSKIMEILFYLTDVYGPRLTGSSNLKAASEWSRDKLSEWGLVNAHLEPWGTFGRGWEVERSSIEMVEPHYLPMIAYPKAWTPGTKGTITGRPVLVDIESEEDFEKYKGKLRDAIVMTQPPLEPETRFTADARRHSDEDLERLAQAPQLGRRARSPMGDDFRARRAIQAKIPNFFREEGAAVLLEPSRGEHGTIFVGRGGSYGMNAELTLPSLVVAIEHYSWAGRLLEKDIPVKLKIDVQTRFLEDDSIGYNIIAQIPGIDINLKDEVVMLGGHLDSWHAGTGATDNAAGCAVMMETVRILKEIEIQPRRTIRIALWSGEEQGFLGSRGYVRHHFGDRRTMELKPEHSKLSAYFNFDNGTGKIRGVYLQGNDAVRPIFEAYMKPFADLGASTLAIRNTSGTDHIPFDEIGLPGFQFIQDPIDYSTRTHHTNMDVYERLQEGDLMQSAVIVASFVYHTAMRDEKLPRKPLPKPRPSQQRERR